MCCFTPLACVSIDTLVGHEPRSPPLRLQRGLTAVIYTFLDSTTPLRLYTSNTYVIASNLYSPAIRLTVPEACQILLVSRTPYILDSSMNNVLFLVSSNYFSRFPYNLSERSLFVCIIHSLSNLSLLQYHFSCSRLLRSTCTSDAAESLPSATQTRYYLVLALRQRNFRLSFCLLSLI